MTDEIAAIVEAPDESVRPHGANLHQKENHRAKYRDEKSREYLKEIRVQYDAWASANAALIGPTQRSNPGDEGILMQRVALFSAYKDFIDQQKYAECFDSRSTLHSSVMEEFIFYLFRDLVRSFPGAPLVGKSHSFKDLFFFPTSFSEMVTRPSLRIEVKDHDFVIGSNIEARFNCRGVAEVETAHLDVPAVAIECKTYLDKTMLEGSSTAAEQLKHRNPNALYIVVMEWLKLTSDVNLRKYKVDQIYVFRRQKNTDREYRYLDGYEKRPVDAGVVAHLFDTVRRHLTAPWGGGVEEGLERGWLL